MRILPILALSVVGCAAHGGRSSNNHRNWNGGGGGGEGHHGGRDGGGGRGGGGSSHIRIDDNLLDCQGYVSAVYGDPHITTFDGLSSTCQAEGEFVLVNSDSLQIQSKFEMISRSAASVTTGIAAQYGDSAVIQVSNAEFTGSKKYTLTQGCPIHIYVDGALQSAKSIEGDGYEITVSSSSIDIQFYDDDGAASAAISLQSTSMHQNGGTCYFTAYVCLPSSDQDMLDSTVGLLGSPNGDSTDEWMTSSGETLKSSQNGQKTYDYCTSHHCVYTEEASLFVHEDARGGKSFSDLMNCDADFQGDVDISDPDPEIVEICGEGNVECIVDGTVAGVEGAKNSADTQDTVVAIHISNTTVEATPDTSCKGDIELLHTTGESEYDQIPFVILEQNGDSVVLRFRTTFFEGVDAMYIEYKNEMEEKCIKKKNVLSNYAEDITVTCLKHTEATMLTVVASDSSLDADVDDATVPACCHGDYDSRPMVAYTFVVSCVSQCIDDTE